jgi:hypothetical protein
MKSCRQLYVAIAVIAAFVIGAAPSQAQYHTHDRDRHPAYLHALSDLRLMRAYLDRMTPNERIDESSQNAINEIDAAIRVIKEASFDDGKDLRDHPPIDTRIEPFDRFHRALDAGNAAYADINREEDNGYARGLKQRALVHITEANNIVGHIIEHLNHHHNIGNGGNGYNSGYAPQPPAPVQQAPQVVDHPAYQRALSDLREMRAYLERPTAYDRVDPDTQIAIDSVEATIRDIKQANIDDDVHYHHPQIDPRLPLPARLHLAREAGNRAYAEIEHDLDFVYADSLRRRTMEKIERANHAIDRVVGRITHK